MNTKFKLRIRVLIDAVQRTTINLHAVGVFAIALAYGGGLWLNLLHQADGATELNEPPPLIHWLRDSTLMLPLVLVSVFAAILLARRLLQRYGQGAPRILENAVIVATIAMVTSAATAAASPIHGILFGAHHHVGDAELPLAIHMVYDGTLALVGNLVLSSILFALFRGRLWGARAVRQIRVSNPVGAKGGEGFHLERET